MAGASSSYVAARLLTPDYLVRGADNAIACPLWRGGGLVEVTEAGSTVSIYAGSGAIIVDAEPIELVDDVARYTIPASALPASLPYGMGWRVEWSLVVDGVAALYRNSAGLIRSQLVPVVTDRDLFRRESSLDPNGAAPISSLEDYQDFRDEAWISILGRLSAKGNLPHLIMEPTALREPHMLLTLHLIFEDFRTRLNETWTEKAREYGARFEKSMNDLAFEYAPADDGIASRRKRGASATVWLGGFD